MKEQVRLELSQILLHLKGLLLNFRPKAGTLNPECPERWGLPKSSCPKADSRDCTAAGSDTEFLCCWTELPFGSCSWINRAISGSAPSHEGLSSRGSLLPAEHELKLEKEFTNVCAEIDASTVVLAPSLRLECSGTIIAHCSFKLGLKSPFHLCLRNSWDYRHAPPCPANI
ncbi:hypothetical protein AAY473_023129 [Plecturocebus cupreus]